MLVPHWASTHVAAFLKSHGVEFKVHEGFTRGHTDRVGPQDDDKFTFPSATADAVQRLVDRIEPPLYPPWESQ